MSLYILFCGVGLGVIYLGPIWCAQSLLLALCSGITLDGSWRTIYDARDWNKVSSIKVSRCLNSFISLAPEPQYLWCEKIILYFLIVRSTDRFRQIQIYYPLSVLGARKILTTYSHLKNIFWYKNNDALMNKPQRIRKARLLGLYNDPFLMGIGSYHTDNRLPASKPSLFLIKSSEGKG